MLSIIFVLGKFLMVYTLDSTQPEVLSMSVFPLFFSVTTVCLSLFSLIYFLLCVAKSSGARILSLLALLPLLPALELLGLAQWAPNLIKIIITFFLLMVSISFVAFNFSRHTNKLLVHAWYEAVGILWIISTLCCTAYVLDKLV